MESRCVAPGHGAGVSERLGGSRRPVRAVAAAEGRRARRRHGLSASLSALRRIDRRAHRGGHGRRRRRLQRPAAPRARRAAARRPADGAGRAVRRRRLGPHLGEVVAAPLPQRGRRCTATRSATCSSWRCGSCSATRSPGSTGSAGCSARTAGCCRWPSVPLDIVAEVRARPGGPRSRTVRGQVAVRADARPGAVGHAGAGRPAGAARGGRRRSLDADWVVLGPGLVVHQRAAAPAGARAAPGRCTRPERQAAGHAQPRPAAGRDRRLLPAAAPGGARRARAGPARRRRARRRRRGRRPRRAGRRPRPRSARGSSWPTWPPADGSPRHDPRRLASVLDEIFRQKR